MTPDGEWDGFKDLYERLLDIPPFVLPPVRPSRLRVRVCAYAHAHARARALAPVCVCVCVCVCVSAVRIMHWRARASLVLGVVCGTAPYCIQRAMCTACGARRNIACTAEFQQPHERLRDCATAPHPPSAARTRAAA